MATFGGIAEALGDVGAARFVAQSARTGELSEDCPTHRLVMKSGELGLGNQELQKQLLKREGISISEYVVDRTQFGFEAFHSTKPLSSLREHQAQLPARITLSPYLETPTEIAGVDLSYLEDGTAVACYAVVETATGGLVWSKMVHREVRFPYISGYLAYRELPILLELMAEVKRERTPAEVVFVDGNGWLHPRRAGIASHLGVLADLRTVGVGKKLLCGQVKLDAVEPHHPQPILQGEELLGKAMKSEKGSRPVFVSPGHQIDVDNATRLARLLFHGHRLPEPIFYADSLSRLEAQAIMSSLDRAADPSFSHPESP